MIVCVECHTEAEPDQRLGFLRLCFWCAELQRLNPHPTRTVARKRWAYVEEYEEAKARAAHRDTDLPWVMRRAELR